MDVLKPYIDGRNVSFKHLVVQPFHNKINWEVSQALIYVAAPKGFYKYK